MRKAITLTLSVALLGIFAAVVVAAVGPSGNSASTLPTTTTETNGTTTAEDPLRRDTGVDISGPCDEAEHANDPRCAGVRVPATPDAPAGVDISGPCDEAEHIGDPRCSGVGAGGAGRVDNSGPGSANPGRGDDFDDDRHGDDFDDDSSGPGRGGDDDDFDDDSSGSGGGDDFDDDSSGSGGGNSGPGGGG
jgi:hypothetical protein